MVRLIRLFVMGALAALLIVSTGCAKPPTETKQPTVAPPAIKSAGTLVVGVDLDTPPFAGVDQGKQAGIDVDVAAALADELGLSVKYVDVKPSEAASALAQADVDVVLSVPFTGAGSTQVALAGTYITDAPAFFVAAEGTGSVEPSMTLDGLPAAKVGVQQGSQAFWLVQDELGPEMIVVFNTLREAVQALDEGKVGVVAGDALVGTYIARDFPNVQFAGQVGTGLPLAAAVAQENAVLADKVRGALDQLAADGILDSIRTKWVGDLPELQVQESTVTTATP